MPSIVVELQSVARDYILRLCKAVPTSSVLSSAFHMWTLLQDVEREVYNSRSPALPAAPWPLADPPCQTPR
jgi:hypothetical protein